MTGIGISIKGTGRIREFYVFWAFCGYFFYFCWSVGEKRQATCHKEEMADRNVRPPLFFQPFLSLTFFQPSPPTGASAG